MHKDQHGNIHLNPTWQHRGPASCSRRELTSPSGSNNRKQPQPAKREQHLKELWGPIQLRSSVLLSEAASVSVTPLVRTAQGLIRLDGTVHEFDRDHAWVRIILLTRRKSQGVQFELHRIHAHDLDHFGLEPTCWQLSDLRRSAIIRSRRHNLNDGWSDLRSATGSWSTNGLASHHRHHLQGDVRSGRIVMENTPLFVLGIACNCSNCAITSRIRQK